MNPIRFKMWLESKEESIPDLWTRTSVDTSFVNEEAVIDFTERMSNRTISAMMFDLILEGKSIETQLYKEPISENLINIKNKRLQNATGIISSQSKPVFGFHMMGNNSGNMLIQFPPTVFTDEDQKVLKSIILHESVHAYDWAMDRLNDDYPIGNAFKFDTNKYARNLFEVRSFVAQLKMLIKEIGNINKLTYAFSHGPFALPDELLPIVLQYLRKNINEGIGRLLLPLAAIGGAAAGAGAAAITGNSNEHPNKPVPIEVKQQTAQAQQAAKLMYQIVELMKFSNFVQR